MNTLFAAIPIGKQVVKNELIVSGWFKIPEASCGGYWLEQASLFNYSPG
ncbi:MAG: hypothetical protein R2792_12560 [Saprospiraceae bacterium]